MSTTVAASDAPLFAECVIGYRAWEADTHDRLWPISARRRPWLPGINTARCNCRSNWPSLRFEWSTFDGRRVLEPAPGHAAPFQGCDCGLYSWRRPKERWRERPLRSSPRRVVGAIASWGAVQVHNDGFRAEHACVVTLAYHPRLQPEAHAVLERIARRYRVDLVTIDELEQAASRHGTPLADDVRPQAAGPVTSDLRPAT
jgi:hypothetical protein